MPHANLNDEAALLSRLHSLPPEARLTPHETAIYLPARLDLLRTWRCRGRGPAFTGRGHFVRYRKRDLDAFLTDQPMAA
jgi:hypothetical protein